MRRVILAVLGWITFLGAQVAYAQESTSPMSGLGDFYPLLILLVVFGGIFYFMLIRPQRRRTQKMNELVSGLKRGDLVTTAGGIFGEIESVGDTTVVLSMEDGSKLRIAKTSIVRKRDK